MDRKRLNKVHQTLVVLEVIEILRISAQENLRRSTQSCERKQ